LIVIDSTAALVPKAEIEGEMGQAVVGMQARLMSQALRKLTAIMAKSKTCVVFINQLRQKIGVLYGNPETTPGGLALKFYASVRLDIRRIEAIKNGDEVIGSHVRVKVVKNKTAPPFRQAEFDIMFGSGISANGSLLDMGSQSGIIEKSGAWYIYKGDKLGQGRDNAVQFLNANPKLAKTLEEEIRAQYEKTAEDAVKQAADATAAKTIVPPAKLPASAKK
jgi:recombination protein RecA